jgi:peptidylprolyl isomerase
MVLGLLLAVATGCGGPTLPDGVYARIFTNRGVILARLEPELTPLAVANFVGLAEGTISNDAFETGRPYYDGTVIHRVEPGHVIQMGIPASDRARGPGYVFPNQIHADLSHDHAGALNFANAGPHTNAGQWCITLGDRSYLDGDYIVFGEVVEGMDVVFNIVRDDVVDSVRIVRAGPEAREYHPDTELFRRQAEEAEAWVREHEALKARAESEWLRERFPDEDIPPGQVWSAVLSRGSGPPGGTPARVRYRGSRVRYLAHLLGYSGPPLEVTPFGSTSNGDPGAVDPPQSFSFEPGVGSLNPALDSILPLMAPGERRAVVVPAEHGYGSTGIYPPETPGEPRFVIGPNTLLVYELEVLKGG